MSKGKAGVYSQRGPAATAADREAARQIQSHLDTLKNVNKADLLGIMLRLREERGSERYRTAEAGQVSRSSGPSSRS